MHRTAVPRPSNPSAAPASRRRIAGRAGAVVAAALLTLAAASCSSSSGDPAAQPVATTPGSATGGTAADEQFAPIRILVSNDDGVGADGIDVMVEALRGEPNVTVVVSAPAANQSGTGGKTTPGGVEATTTTTKSGYEATSVAGFPADSVNWALDHPTGGAPDLVISGINNGQNIGTAVDLSGTIGAARAAALRGIPAVAVSAGLATAPATPDFDGAAGVVIDWLREHRAAIAAKQVPPSVTSFNEPSCPTGSPRGLLEVPVATDLAGRNLLAPSDCTSTVTNPPDDVDAFVNGFTTESAVPLTPAA